jgi:hypothetical protein
MKQELARLGWMLAAMVVWTSTYVAIMKFVFWLSPPV